MILTVASSAAATAGDGRWLADHLQRFFERRAPIEPGDRLLIAHSGGADSTALLWGMARLAADRRCELSAAHLDHALDAGSGGRAAAARRSCERLGVPLRVARIEVAARRRRGESPEAAARRVRYRFLEGERRALGARWLLTAHHADDQAETLLLRLLQGTGIGGLAGIAAVRGRLVRPLLGIPRAELGRALAGSGLRPAEDPTNADLGVPRNRVRALLVPALAARWPELRRDLGAVAAAAAGARERLEPLAAARAGVRREGDRVTLDRAALAALPAALWPFALARAGWLAGLPYPPGRDARRELGRQLAAGGEIGCDQGGGWRWRSRGGRLELVRAPRRPSSPSFSYTFPVPGQVAVRELGVTVRLMPSRIEGWMRRGAAERAGLGLRLRPGEAVTVRSRRPGDRLRPLGCAYRRKLKEVLIDRRVPRRERDRLPLLEVGGRIAWVPGVTVDHDCRLEAGSSTWLAEIVRP